MSWICSTCQQSHEGMPLSFAADFPDKFANISAEDRETRALIGSDQCILDDSECYLRGLIEIPIHDAPEPFLWGVWASMGRSAAQWRDAQFARTRMKPEPTLPPQSTAHLR